MNKVIQQINNDVKYQTRKYKSFNAEITQITFNNMRFRYDKEIVKNIEGTYITNSHIFKCVDCNCKCSLLVCRCVKSCKNKRN
jgi:hypothetical protein